MGYSADSFVAGEQPTTSKWNKLWQNDASFNDGTGIGNGVILPNHLFASASTLNDWTWDTWTPTWTNFTPGSATITAKYNQIGKTVRFYLKVTLSGSTMGSDPYFTLPVPASSTELIDDRALGLWHCNDFGTADFEGVALLGSTTTCKMYKFTVSGSNISHTALSSTVPMTWANNDSFNVRAFYEAA